MLGNLVLPQVQQIDTYDRRMLAEHKPPGMAGSLLQNLGRQPTCVLLWGVATGPTALAFTKKLDALFRARTPVAFTSDVVADSRIQKVLIEDAKFCQLAGKPERFSYALRLKESIKPGQAPPPSSVDSNAQKDAQQSMNNFLASVKP
jgi:hypothetical protein